MPISRFADMKKIMPLSFSVSRSVGYCATTLKAIMEKRVATRFGSSFIRSSCWQSGVVVRTFHTTILRTAIPCLWDRSLSMPGE